jgi:hypothetical protein
LYSWSTFSFLVCNFLSSFFYQCHISGLKEVNSGKQDGSKRILYRIILQAIKNFKLIFSCCQYFYIWFFLCAEKVVWMCTIWGRITQM